MVGIEWERVRLFVRPGTSDLRKQINGLALMVEDVLGLDPSSESLFLFCKKQWRILRLLYWQCNGFCLWQKRLEKYRFPWPERAEETHREIDAAKLTMLLEGIDFWHAHERLPYTRVG